MKIRKIRPEESDLVRKILGDAFADDPIMRYTLPNIEYYGKYFEDIFLKQFCKYGLSIITENLNAIALWLPPKVKLQIPSLPFLLGWGYHFYRDRNGLSDMLLVNRIITSWEKAKPTVDHYYLLAVGVLENDKGKGIGSKLIKESLNIYDAEEKAAYLENTNIKNIPFYENLGFKLVGDYQFAENSPKTYFMFRDGKSYS